MHDEPNYDKTPIIPSLSSNFNNVRNEPFTEKEFTDALTKLKPNKATGYDRVSNKMLKNSPLEIKDTLFKYYNICLMNGMVSESNCYDLITSILKEGSAGDPNNYRGIYLCLFRTFKTDVFYDK